MGEQAATRSPQQTPNKLDVCLKVILARLDKKARKTKGAKK